MKVITTMQNAIETLQDANLPQNVIKDILLNTYIFETEFKGSTLNQIIILEKDENYLMPHTIPELEEDIDNYHKILYIISDTGEGVLTYSEQIGSMASTPIVLDDNQRIITLLHNAISYIEDTMLNGDKLINTKIANELGITNEEYEHLMSECPESAEDSTTNLAERRKITTK